MVKAKQENKKSRRQKGFTFVELVIIIIILGLLSTVAGPMFQNIHVEAEKNALRGSLYSMREAIHSWASNKAVNGGGFVWPSIDTLSANGMVMMQNVPPNPFQTNAPDSIVVGAVKGQVYGTRGGWAYNSSSGEIWANTSSMVPGSGCSGQQALNENTW